jgi:hypothetical protein
MRKEDWIKVIESTFVKLESLPAKQDDLKNKNIEVIGNKLILRGNIEHIDDKHQASYPLPLNSTVYTMPDVDEIEICTKNIMDNQSADKFQGDCIILNKELEVCILAGILSINMIPWPEVTTITTEYQI